MRETGKRPWKEFNSPEDNWGQVLKAAIIYFAVVFGIGFVLGTIRVLWVVARLGVRNAELLEQPLMLIAVFLTAKWIGRRFGSGLSRLKILGVGFVALLILVVAEVAMVLLIQPNRTRDPISGAAYLLSLAVFAIMPWLVSTRRASSIVAPFPNYNPRVQ
jgi:hypothetical protein